jgi:hypothetical protein
MYLEKALLIRFGCRDLTEEFFNTEVLGKLL